MSAFIQARGYLFQPPWQVQAFSHLLLVILPICYLVYLYRARRPKKHSITNMSDRAVVVYLAHIGKAIFP